MISIVVDSIRLRSMLAGVQALGSDLSDEMDEVAATIIAMTDLAFRQQTAPHGNRWASLSPVTISRRRGSSQHILRDTGVLSSSFFVRKLSQMSVEVGTEDIRAPTHQYGARQGALGRTSRGGPIPWGDIPARPMMPNVTSSGFITELTEALENAVRRKIERL